MANIFEKAEAYELLLRLRRLEVIGDVMQIYLTDSVELIYLEKSVVLSHVELTYSTKDVTEVVSLVTGLEFPMLYCKTRYHPLFLYKSRLNLTDTIIYPI